MMMRNTLRQKQSEKGRVTMMMMRERQVRAHLNIIIRSNSVRRGGADPFP